MQLPKNLLGALLMLTCVHTVHNEQKISFVSKITLIMHSKVGTNLNSANKSRVHYN